MTSPRVHAVELPWRSEPPRHEFAPDNLGVAFLHANGVDPGDLLPGSLGPGCALFDANGDALLDLYLTNCAPPATGRFYLMERGRFVDRTVESGLALPALARAGQGVCAADYDGDGDLDLCLTFRGPNVLLRNEGGHFTDVTRAAGLGAGRQPECSTQAAFIDHDGDGWLDLDVHVRSAPGPQGRSYRNRGDGTFEEGVWRGAGAPQDRLAGRGVALGDLDGDQDVDAVVLERGGPARVWLNPSAGSQRPLRLLLLDRAPNTYAVGARVTVGGVAREVRAGGPDLCQDELTLTFDLGELAAAEVSVRWPDGALTAHAALAPGHVHVLRR